MLEIGYITKQSSITYIIRNNTVKNMKMYNRAVSYIRVPPPFKPWGFLYYTVYLQSWEPNWF